MSRCCFPCLSCLRPKNKVRSASETSPIAYPGLRASSSLNKLNSRPALSQNIELPCLNKSMQNASKFSKFSGNSHKSMIAIRLHEKFEPQKLKILHKKSESIESLSISKISEVHVSDNSSFDFFGDIILEEAQDQNKNRKNTELERDFKNSKQVRTRNRREPTPMFPKNPCFEATAVISLEKKHNN